MKRAGPCGVLLAVLLVQAACAPALNWRQVPLDRITVLLPCKPDRAQRSLRLGARDVTISMAGCEADGALFAVSHIHQSDAASAAEVARDWRTATLANIRAAAVVEEAMSPVTGATAMTVVSAQGIRPDASGVRAHFAWLVVGDDVFHVAAYASRLKPEHTESLFSDIRIQ